MSTEYLVWYKEMEATLANDPAVINLTASSILQPTHLLVQDAEPVGPHLTQRNPWGLPALRAAIAAHYAAPPDYLLLTPSATSAAYLVMQSLLHAGDHAIVERPGYGPLHRAVEASGAELSHLPRRPEKEYALEPEALARLLRPTTRLIVLTNLHAPSGRLEDEAALRRLAGVVHAHNPAIRIVVDEIYQGFAPGQPPAAQLDERFISINSLSKVYGLSVLRCGWIQATPDILELVRQSYLPAVGSGSLLLESIAARVFERLEAYTQHWQQRLARNRAVAGPRLHALVRDGLLVGELPPAGATFFPRVAGVDDATGLVAQLAQSAGVQVVPGRFFGAPAHIRIGLGGDDERLVEGIRRLDRGLRQWVHPPGAAQSPASAPAAD